MATNEKGVTCDCLIGRAYWDGDNCRCDNSGMTDPHTGITGITKEPTTRYKGGIKMKAVYAGQTNDYYKYVDPRIYQTGGVNQTGTTPQVQTATNTVTGTTATANVTDSLKNFYNQNQLLVLLGVAGLGYMLMKKK